ncbi:MAG: hypothetical protein WCD16_13440, partial [Paracoccaceae bacterium]
PISVEREPRQGSDEARSAAERARARVLKVKRDDLDDMQSDTAEEDEEPIAEESMFSEESEAAYEDQHQRALADDDLYPEDAGDEDMPESADAEDVDERASEEERETDENAGLSPEEEADLMAELAEVESASSHARRDRLEAAAPAEDEANVSRLVSEVNTKLEGPENRRRRSAIAHLKAAVAATVAERRLRPGKNREAEDEAERDPYRKDLAEVVRPGPAADEGQGDRMAPLMLVSEQRIDTPRPAAGDAGAMRPRRVHSGNLALQEEDEESHESATQEDDDNNIFRLETGFAGFAEKVGADELPELLEAAAAYVTRIEGKEKFSRPQVMGLVIEHMGQDSIAREDGLRAFGRLLRDGPFERIKRGEFTISKDSRFMSDSRD